ncbi:dihydrolipoamide dehydrogenase [Devosia lucknowensis]|uniref:Dihydrolipoamide dehydrogenase n=1 Tax=Devosia lucknowensis TaxID=1096929 RepID=A0A1Y6GBM1_9HYPH|nr:dihydrolipoyl dehydrogenase [Devosia lucknowensis]SMQ85459.1 dihydrolipoamide dehydrogenase [Devosia lucknowensis]
MAQVDELECDVAVIGAGTAGLAAMRRALREGAKVLLVDDAFSGTMCANVGCMPSKLLIAAGNAAHDARHADVFGIGVDGIRVDGRRVMGRLRAERDRFAAATRKGFEDFPAGTMITGRARFLSATRLGLEDGRIITARAVVIATGGNPVIPKGFKEIADLCLTHETVFDLVDLPKSIAVIGGGPIGLELSQAFARLGVRTCLFDESETIGGVQDEAMQDLIQKAIGAELTLHLGVKTRGSRANTGARVHWSGAAEGAEIFDHVLIATGRPPQLRDLGLETTGIRLDENGTPEYDRESMQCGTAPIFIAGDANADVPVLHEASSEGRMAGRNAATYPTVVRTPRMTPFSMIFSQPVIARVGAEPTGASVFGTSDYDDQGRAKVEDEALGRVVIHAEPTRGRLTGALLFCPGAEHMAHLLVQAVAHGITASEMLSQPFYHPTLEEGLKPALREICSKIPASGDYDRSISPGS